MMPQYSCMESYPVQRNQTPFAPYQAFPTPMPMDPAKPGTIYEPWPHGGNYGYPMPCHSCCSHGNFSGYYGFRPCVQAPMPSPMHFCGSPTPYSEAYPSYYAPPPHYSVDLPRYEYEKNVPGSGHCCGCPRHFCNPKEEKSVKIEEQEPDVVEKEESDFVLPIQMKNQPHPIVWIPQEYLHNKGQRKSLEPEVREQEKVPPKTKQSESSSLKYSEQEPGIRNGWLPLDINNLRSLTHGEVGKTTHDQQGKEQKRELPFPVIWMPSYDNKEEEVGKSDNRDRNGAKDQHSDDKKIQFPFPIIWMPPVENKREEAGKKRNNDVNYNIKYEENPPSTFNVVPEKHLGDGSSTNVSGVNKENHAAQGGVEKKKIANQKIIPVEEIDEHKVDNSEETKERGRSVPVNKSSESNARRSSSPTKTPKLPPVCLRVDPLPREKKGSSRSPSPPNSKSHPENGTKDTAGASACLDEKAQQVSNCSKEVESNEKEKKVIEGTQREISGNDDGDQMDVSQVPINLPMESMADVCTKLVPDKIEVGATGCPIEKGQEASNVSNAATEEAEEVRKATEAAKSLDAEVKLEKKTLSDVGAAIAIQSAYRGFDVRRWEPLKKLKQIAEIRKQLVDVRNDIQALESSYNVQIDNKQKVVIGETIMRLLLKLDAIQGLPPSLRDVRKSLARQLVTLQEKLDSLVIKNFQESETKVSTSKTAENIDVEVQNRESMQKQEKEEAIDHDEKESSLQDVYESSHDGTKPCGAQPPHVSDSELSLKNEEALVSLFENEVRHTNVEDDLRTRPMAFDDMKHGEGNAEILMEPKDEVVDRELEASSMMVIKKDKTEDDSDADQFVQVPLAVEVTTDSEIHGSSLEASHVTCAQAKDLEEPPHGMIDDKPVTSQFEEDKQFEMDKNEVLQASKVERTLEGTFLTEIDGAMAPDENADMSIEQVPVGLIDGDSALSEVGKRGEAEMEKNNNTLVKDECEVAIDLNPSELPTEKEIKQLNEEAEKSSVVLPEECVKVVCEEDKELPSYLASEGEKERQDGNGIRNCVPEPVESQLMVSFEKENPEDAARGKVEPIENNEEDNDLPLVTTREEEGKEKRERKVEVEGGELECMENEKMQDQEAGYETTKGVVHVEHVEQKGESLPASPTTDSPLSVDGTGEEFETNRKLKEENEKLKEMMEKLLKAGKEQLDCISNLTGRVKNLEKKLATARKKNPRTRLVKRSNIPPTKERVADAVAY
uniref:BAG family molecular chaperone regulator 6 n=1 Tax=Ziziphus nummularia TaxID=498071 RepID=A0A7S8R9A5_9ROSA|nr:BAG family molecular chaperone regulator 6 [Ziziphus nummularia]